MTLRSDHVAGGAAILSGVIVLAVSGELPVGSLSFPGAGLWPKLLAVLMMLFGLALIVGARDGEPLSAIRWGDWQHALPVLLIAAAAIALYATLGFILSM